MTQIKNIIFDLGGVIINLDIPKTISEFNKLTNYPFESFYNQAQQSPLFDLFDKGKISESDFFNELKLILKADLTFEDMLHSWNAMLLDFPVHRLEMLKNLQSNYRIFLLSNTNETHIQAFEKIVSQSHGYKNLDGFFEKTYYSCRMGMRKPDAEIFNFVLQQNNLNPTETIFIDDSIQHVKAAQQCHINSYLLEKNTDVGVLLKNLNIL